MKGNRQGMINEFYMNQDGYTDPTAGYALQKLYREQLQEMRRKELEAQEKEQKKSKEKAQGRKRTGEDERSAEESAGTCSTESRVKKNCETVEAKSKKATRRIQPEVQVVRYPGRKKSEESRRRKNRTRDDRSNHRTADASGKGGNRHD